MMPRPKADPTPSTFVDGLHEVKDVVDVSIKDIDQTATDYQFRFKAHAGDLIKSLKSVGQQDPIILTGEPPFTLIDGFRRMKAFKKLGWTKIKAIVRPKLSHEEAMNISFVRNVKRKNLSIMEKASAMQQYREKGKTIVEIAGILAMTDRQVKRYLELVKFPEYIQNALDKDLIGMAHAKKLSLLPGKEAQKLLLDLANGKISIRQLQKNLQKKDISLKIVQAQKNGFRVFPFKYDKEQTPKKQKEEMIKALESALKVLKGEQ